VNLGLDITPFDALHTMHNGKFLHLPIVDQGVMLQKFWDSALALEAPETDDDSHRHMEHEGAYVCNNTVCW
jgi:hypothetical protein